MLFYSIETTTITLSTTAKAVRTKTTLKSLSKLSFILFNSIMKFNRFINQTIITTSCRPIWDVVALNIGIPTLRAFLLPRILDFNLVVVCAFQFHLGNILSDFLRTVKKNCSGFHFLFSRSRSHFPSRITMRFPASPPTLDFGLWRFVFHGNGGAASYMAKPRLIQVGLN